MAAEDGLMCTYSVTYIVELHLKIVVVLGVIVYKYCFLRSSAFESLGHHFYFMFLSKFENFPWPYTQLLLVTKQETVRTGHEIHVRLYIVLSSFMISAVHIATVCLHVPTVCLHMMKAY